MNRPTETQLLQVSDNLDRCSYCCDEMEFDRAADRGQDRADANYRHPADIAADHQGWV